MSTPFHDEAQKMALAIFDSFSKTVMRNVCRNYQSANIRRKRKELVGSDEAQYIIDGRCETDIYSYISERSEYMRLRFINATRRFWQNFRGKAE